MKRFYLKFRIMLLTIAFGLASVPFYHSIHERWTQVNVALPQVESDAPFIVDVNKQLDDGTLFGKRNLSLYEYGGYIVPCGDDKSAGSLECRNEQQRIRQFFWNNWNAKKLSYITVMDNKSIFIEPDKNGDWHILERTLKNSNMNSYRTNWVAENEYETLMGDKFNLFFCNREGMCFNSL